MSNVARVLKKCDRRKTKNVLYFIIIFFVQFTLTFRRARFIALLNVRLVFAFIEFSSKTKLGHISRRRFSCKSRNLVYSLTRRRRLNE